MSSNFIPCDGRILGKDVFGKLYEALSIGNWDAVMSKELPSILLEQIQEAEENSLLTSYPICENGGRLILIHEDNPHKRYEIHEYIKTNHPEVLQREITLNNIKQRKYSLFEILSDVKYALNEENNFRCSNAQIIFTLLIEKYNKRSGNKLEILQVETGIYKNSSFPLILAD